MTRKDVAMLKSQFSNYIILYERECDKNLGMFEKYDRSSC